ncbi:DUF3742 family protein [Shinella sp.]|uniref:DUF3742 family protein n=1 Tax=Shinella sp. TaxID=1870904 RepID=UPI002587A828|nr:DUF3742 family protein [Shinella sp.]MCW5706964.1 DUF3742 family protein [Shinella sp.]
MAAQKFTAGFGYQLGRGAKRAIGAYLRYEQHVESWLIYQGVPPIAAGLFLASVKFALLGVLFYSATWLLLIVAAVLVISKLDGAATFSEAVDEWPLTTYSELRNTPGYDPNLYNDISHEQYIDD